MLYLRNSLVFNRLTARWKVNEFTSLVSCHWVYLIPDDIHPLIMLWWINFVLKRGSSSTFQVSPYKYFLFDLEISSRNCFMLTHSDHKVFITCLSRWGIPPPFSKRCWTLSFKESLLLSLGGVRSCICGLTTCSGLGNWGWNSFPSWFSSVVRDWG